MTKHELRAWITDQIIEAIRKDLPKWEKPWESTENIGPPTNVVTKKPYKGRTLALLEQAAKRRGYSSKWWATEEEWQSVGGIVGFPPLHIRESEWGISIVMTGNQTRKMYNVEQVEGKFRHLVAIYTNYEEDVVFEKAEKVIRATFADIRFGGVKAKYYYPPYDCIVCPRKEQFRSPRHYYASLFHELAHYAEHRVGWDHQDRYALGELVAEIAGFFMAAEAGVQPTDSWESLYAYLQYWLGKHGGGEASIRDASEQAGKVADFIFSFWERTNGA